jgi:hypothetical protein
MRNLVLLIVVAAFVLVGCGRKEPPQVMADAPAPKIVSFKHSVESNALYLTMKISGGAYGVGYQVDRSEIDPSCKCPSFWRRHYEEVPTKKNLGNELSKVIWLRQEKEFAFRVRAIDALGRFTEWTNPFLAKAPKINE